MDNLPSPPIPSPRALVLSAVFFEGGLGLLAVVLGLWWNCPPAAAVRFQPAAVGWGVGASLPMLALLVTCLRLRWRPLVRLRRLVDRFLVPLFRDCRIMELLVISLLAGVGEEMLFRGVLQEVIGRWYGGDAGPWVGLAAASLLFGLAHAITPTYSVLATLIGLYLGAIWMAAENLLVPIVTHAAYDFLALVYLIRLYKPMATAEPPE